jgi:hypothetical protein
MGVLSTASAAGAKSALPAAPPDQLRAALAPSAGRARLVHLWASWCRPCVAEWPRLAKWLRGVAPELDVVAIAVEDDGVAPARVLAPLGRLPARLWRARADELAPLVQAIDPEWDGALPTTLLLDAGGRLALAQHGITVPEELQSAVAHLAAASHPLPSRERDERGKR